MTVTQIRDHVETDLVDDAVKRLIADAEAVIATRCGGASRTDELDGCGSTSVWLKQKASSITSVTERTGNTTTTLVAGDYRLRYGGLAIERRNDGTNPSSFWGDVVTVVYAPLGMAATVERVTVDLVKLAARYSGVKGEGVGDFNENTFGQNYDTEREKILSGLNANIRRFA